jgi:flagellar M-ring protein FliF
VSVTANLPDGDTGAQQGKNSNRANRSEETVNYEITKTVKSHVREAGMVRRLSVAILVDGATATDAEGKATYTPRSAEELERLTALAKSAIGFNQQRGDTLELANLRFAQIDAPEAMPAPSMFDLSRQDLFQIAWILVSAILGLLVVLFFLKPLASGFYEVAVSAPAGGGATPLLPNRAPPAPAQLAPPAPDGEAPPQPSMPGLEQMIDLDRVEGRVKASSIKKIGEIVEKHPEEAVAIMRSWMYQEN